MAENENLDLEERKLRLEERKLEEEVNSNKRRCDLEGRKYDLEERESKKTNPLFIGVVGALIAVAGALIVAFASIGVSFLNGQYQMSSENFKAEANRILEAEKLGDQDRTACTLNFLMKAGLITTKSVSDFIEAYLRARNGVGDAPTQTSSIQQTGPSGQQKVQTTTICQPLPNVGGAKEAPSNQNGGKPSSNAEVPQIFTYSTDWMGGGHNQNEACEEGIRENQERFPNKILSRVSSDEAVRKDIFGHVEYKYYCTIAVK